MLLKDFKQICSCCDVDKVILFIINDDRVLTFNYYSCFCRTNFYNNYYISCIHIVRFDKLSYLAIDIFMF